MPLHEDDDDDIEVETVLAKKFDRASASAATFALTILAGPDRGKSFVLGAGQPSRVLIGQSPACELRLSDQMISRRHVAIELQGARLRVTDLASTNGTTINGITLLDAMCSGGEQVQIGETTIRLDMLAGVEKVQLPTATRFGRLVGQSAEMRKLYPLCERLAASNKRACL